MSAHHSPLILRGLFVPIVTPFGDDGELDHASLTKLADSVQSAEGVTGLVTSARIGEGPVLTAPEQAEVLRQVVSTVPRETQIIATVGGQSTSEILERIEEAATAGATAAMVFPPLFLAWGEVASETKVAFYRDLGDRAALPLVLFQIPVRSYWLTAEEVAEIARLDSVVAMKDATFDMQLYSDTMRAIEGIGPFEVLNGNDRFVAEGAIMGSTGALIGIANLLPRAWAEVQRLGEWGDAKESLALQAELRPLQNAIFREPILDAPARIKAALMTMGTIAGDHVRKPQTGISDHEKRSIDAVMEQLVHLA